jgi:hypothetical protein
MSIYMYLRRRSAGPKVQRRDGAVGGPARGAARGPARGAARGPTRSAALSPARSASAVQGPVRGPCIAVEAQPLQTRSVFWLARPWYLPRQSRDLA